MKIKNIVWLCASVVLAVQAADAAGQNNFNVRAFGAVGNGTNLDSPAINKTIEACAQAGGGTVLIPAGTYLSGSIRLKSNIHLLIDAGAVILGAPQAMNAYDEAEPFAGPAYQDGGHTYFHNSLIWGENLTNVFISGNGMINGGALSRGRCNRPSDGAKPLRPGTRFAPTLRWTKRRCNGRDAASRRKGPAKRPMPRRFGCRSSRPMICAPSIC